MVGSKMKRIRMRWPLIPDGSEASNRLDDMVPRQGVVCRQAHGARQPTMLPSSSFCIQRKRAPTAARRKARMELSIRGAVGHRPQFHSTRSGHAVAITVLSRSTRGKGTEDDMQRQSMPRQDAPARCLAGLTLESVSPMELGTYAVARSDFLY